MGTSAGIGGLLRMEGLLEPLAASGDPGRFFLATYLRTTRAVAEELDRGGFRDPAWVERDHPAPTGIDWAEAIREDREERERELEDRTSAVRRRNDHP